MTNPPDEMKTSTILLDIRRMIEEARTAVAVTVNTGLTMLYWRIGKRIYDAKLGGKRAEYGEEILATLSQELVQEYGSAYRLTRTISTLTCSSSTAS